MRTTRMTPTRPVSATCPTTCRMCASTRQPIAGSNRGSARSSTRCARATPTPATARASSVCYHSAMLDINLLRNDLAAVAAGLARRGVALDVARFEALERERKDIQTRTQELQNRRNVQSKAIGAAKAKGEDTSALLAEVAGLGDELKR